MKPMYVISLLLFIIIGFSIYQNSLRGKFLWDDLYLIENNTLIQSIHNIPKIFLSPLHPKFVRYYRPLQNISYMFDYYVWKLNSFGYHLTNIGLHIANSFLLYIALIFLFKNNLTSILSASIFLVHTGLSEPVNFLSSRSNLLVTIFILASFICYLKSREQNNPRLYFVSLIFFGLSLFTNEIALVFAVMLFIYNFLFRESKAIKKIVPFVALAAGYLLLRVSVVPTSLIVTYKFTGITSIFKLFIISLKVMVFPMDLHKNWSGAELMAVSSQTAVILAICFWAIVILLFFVDRKPFFGAVWFTLILLSAIIFSSLKGYVLSEGWLYVASIGFFILLTYAFGSLFRFSIGRITAIGIFSLMFATYSYFTISRNAVWGNPLRFYQELLSQKGSPSDQIFVNMGGIFLKERNYNKAMFCYNRALRLNPRSSAAFNGIGVIYLEKRLFENALSMFYKAVSVYPSCITEPLYNIALVYSKQNKLELAKNAYERVIECNPSHIPSLRKLVILYAKDYEDEKALAIINKFPQIRQQFGIK